MPGFFLKPEEDAKLLYGWVRISTEKYGAGPSRKRLVSPTTKIPRRKRLVFPTTKIRRFSLKVKGGLGESENLLFS